MSDTMSTTLNKRHGRNKSLMKGLTIAIDAESELRVQELLNALPAAIYMTDQRGRITFYNEAATKLWGTRPTLGASEWCGSWRMFWPDGSPLPHDECPMAIALKEQRSINGMEAVAERPDGTRVPFLAFPSPLRNSSGVLVGAINMLVDISERKHGEEIGQRLASIVESSDDAIISKDLNGIITSWNKAAEKLFGYAAEEIIGKPVLTLIPPERENEEVLILDRIRRGDRVEHYDTARVRKDGSLVDVSLTVSPIKDGDGKIIGASKIARNITERKRNDAFVTLLSREVDHRAKNLLATVQATVNLTEGETPQDIKNAISGRIRALANAHTLLAKSRWEGASLESLAKQELAPYCGEENSRVLFSGPNLALGPKAAQSVAMVLHELATNAAKYGSLSVVTGHVRIAWSITAGGDLALQWNEKGGPKVSSPSRQGFGTRVMTNMTTTHLRGGIHFNWDREGLICDVHIPADQLSESH